MKGHTVCDSAYVTGAGGGDMGPAGSAFSWGDRTLLTLGSWRLHLAQKTVSATESKRLAA